MSKFVEFRCYTLQPGAGAAFHRLVLEAALPLLARWGVDVVTAGPSLHDPDSYYLIRAFADLAVRQTSEDAFYGSTEWQQGPRAAILALIATYSEVVLELDDVTVAALRSSGSADI